jgi:2-dehydro-3-deoxygluconokinase
MKNKIVTFGEIMLRLATGGYERFSQAKQFMASFGGGEANVAVSLANFGLNVDFVTRLPENDIAHACLMELRKHNVGTDKIIFGGERLGIYFLESGAVARPSKVIYDRSNSSIATIKQGMINWEAIFEDATWFHWTGITPAISEDAALACKEAIDTANKMGVKVSVDLNYRKNLWKWGKKASEVMPDLVSGCDLILGNEEDAEKIFAISPKRIDTKYGLVESTEYQSVCIRLMEKFPKAKQVIITLRSSINANHNKWSGVLYDGKKFYNAPIYDITHIVDRVGGGDSFMGGLIYGLFAFPENTQKALNFAVASSCLKHTVKGDFNLVTVKEVEALMDGDGTGRISR